jgi:uncharacterized protein (TIGR03086 family)
MSAHDEAGTGTVDLRGLFGRALDEFDRRMTVVPADRWSAPTPCTEWDVRALVAHVVNEQLWAPALLSGQTTEQVGDRFDGDVLGDEALEAWRTAAGRARTAVESLDGLDTTVHVSYGDVPAARYLTEMTLDATVHAWDLARAVDADEQLEPELVGFALSVVEPNLALLAESGMFGPPLPVDDDASSQDRLLALLGRRP